MQVNVLKTFKVVPCSQAMMDVSLTTEVRLCEVEKTKYIALAPLRNVFYFTGAELPSTTKHKFPEGGAAVALWGSIILQAMMDVSLATEVRLRKVGKVSAGRVACFLQVRPSSFY